MGFGGTYKVKQFGLFNPNSKEPYRISRSKIDLFVECPRCYWLDARYGVKRPDMPAFSLNNAVDELLKREFDIHRAQNSKHPLLKKYGIDAVPFAHKDMDAWRDALRRGIEFLHEETNLSVRGGIDDVWVTPKGELLVVDYKATSKRKEIELYDSYKRQVEVYQWLFRRNGFTVSNTAYFVYVNGNADAEAFDGKLEFDIQLIAHEGNDAWIEGVLQKIKATLMSDEIPPVGECDYCPYREAAGKTLLGRMKRVVSTKTKRATVEEYEAKPNKTATLF